MLKYFFLKFYNPRLINAAPIPKQTANIIEEIQKNISKIASADLNFFSKFIQEFSKDMPFFYGLFSIMFAVCLGIGAAFIRRGLSNLRKKYFSKSAK